MAKYSKKIAFELGVRETTGEDSPLIFDIDKIDLIKLNILFTGIKLNDVIPDPVPGNVSFDGLPPHFKQFINNRVMPKFQDEEGKFIILKEGF
jgi:hypothetical protein